MIPSLAQRTVLLTSRCATDFVGVREVRTDIEALRAIAIYMSNLYFARSASDYFSARVTFNPLLHTWSLSVEEQFYLFWPLLIALGLLIWRSRNALLASMALLTVVSFGINLWLTDH